MGLYTDYWENDAALYRLGNHSFIRTEVGDRQQLNGERKPKLNLEIPVENTSMDDGGLVSSRLA